MKHKHHIIPKHMGGSSDPENIIELSIEEHAEAHRLLYEEHGRPQDYAAWKGLSGMMNKQEIIHFLQSTCSTKSNQERLENKTHNFLGDNNPSRKKVKEGTHHFQHNIGNRPGDIIQRELVAKGEHNFQTQEHADAVGIRTRKAIEKKCHPYSKQVKCPHCPKKGQEAAMRRWHFENCKLAPHVS
jgi:hypothetical protein